jgi:hypothetical protein
LPADVSAKERRRPASRLHRRSQSAPTVGKIKE